MTTIAQLSKEFSGIEKNYKEIQNKAIGKICLDLNYRNLNLHSEFKKAHETFLQLQRKLHANSEKPSTPSLDDQIEMAAFESDLDAISKSLIDLELVIPKIQMFEKHRARLAGFRKDWEDIFRKTCEGTFPKIASDISIIERFISTAETELAEQKDLWDQAWRLTYEPKVEEIAKRLVALESEFRSILSLHLTLKSKGTNPAAGGDLKIAGEQTSTAVATATTPAPTTAAGAANEASVTDAVTPTSPSAAAAYAAVVAGTASVPIAKDPSGASATAGAASPDVTADIKALNEATAAKAAIPAIPLSPSSLSLNMFFKDTGTNRITCIEAISPAGWIISAGDGKRVWIHNLRGEYTGGMKSLAHVEGWNVGWYNVPGHILNWAHYYRKTYLSVDHQITCLHADPYDVVFGTKDGMVRIIWDPTPLKGHTKPITSITSCPDVRRLFSADEDGIIHSWRSTPKYTPADKERPSSQTDMTTVWNMEATLKSPLKPITGLAVFNDGYDLLSGAGANRGFGYWKFIELMHTNPGSAAAYNAAYTSICSPIAPTFFAFKILPATKSNNHQERVITCGEKSIGIWSLTNLKRESAKAESVTSSDAYEDCIVAPHTTTCFTILSDHDTVVVGSKEGFITVISLKQKKCLEDIDIKTAMGMKGSAEISAITQFPVPNLVETIREDAKAKSPLRVIREVPKREDPTKIFPPMVVIGFTSGKMLTYKLPDSVIATYEVSMRALAKENEEALAKEKAAVKPDFLALSIQSHRELYGNAAAASPIPTNRVSSPTASGSTINVTPISPTASDPTVIGQPTKSPKTPSPSADTDPFSGTGPSPANPNPFAPAAVSPKGASPSTSANLTICAVLSTAAAPAAASSNAVTSPAAKTGPGSSPAAANSDTGPFSLLTYFGITRAKSDNPPSVEPPSSPSTKPADDKDKPPVAAAGAKI